MSRVKAVLTDIGGVVLAVHEERSLRALAEASGLTAEEVLALLGITEEVIAQLYSGQWSMRDFHQRTGEPLRSAVNYESFAGAWLAMLGEDFPAVRRAYEALPPDVALYTLSNTNELHLDWLRRHWLYRRSAGFFASCEMGLQKPQPEAFQFVLERMGLPAGEVLFFDDNADNVAAAGRLGIRAVHVTDPQLVPATLRELGIIS